MPGKETISQQDTNFCELFSFFNWQGVGLIRYMYWVSELGFFDQWTGIWAPWVDNRRVGGDSSTVFI